MNVAQPFFFHYVELFIQYLLSPAIVGAVLYFAFSRTLQLGEVRKDFETLKDDVAELKKKTTGLTSNVTVIRTHLVDKAGLNADLFKIMSPLSLARSGKRLVKAVGFVDFVKENEASIQAFFKKQKPKTLLELDELSESFVTSMYEAGKLGNYENEAFKRGLYLEVLLRACALYLRDYFAKVLSITD